MSCIDSHGSPTSLFAVAAGERRFLGSRDARDFGALSMFAYPLLLLFAHPGFVENGIFAGPEQA